MPGTRALEVCLVIAATAGALSAQLPEQWTAAMTKGELALASGDHRAATAAFDAACAVAGLNTEGLALCTHGQAVASQLAGDYHKARQGYERALPLWDRIPGSATFKCASLVNLGQVYRDLRIWNRAVETLRKTREIALRDLGARSAVYARAVTQLGIVLGETGDPREGESLLREGIAVLREVNIPPDQDLAVPLASLGQLQAQEWRYDEARPLIEEASRILTGSLGETHPLTATVLAYQGSLYRSIGEPERAWPLLRKAERAVESAWGRRHPWMATILSEQAALAATEGKTSTALELMKEVGGTFTSLFGEDSMDFAMVRNNIGEILTKRGQLREAEPLLLSALRAVEKGQDKPNANRASVHANLGELYRRLQDGGQAEQHYKSAIEMYRNLGGADRRMAHAMSGYSRLLQTSRRDQSQEQARKLERESKSILGRK